MTKRIGGAIFIINSKVSIYTQTMLSGLTKGIFKNRAYGGGTKISRSLCGADAQLLVEEQPDEKWTAWWKIWVL